MSAFALFFFQPPSLLEYQRRMKEQTGRSNVARVLGIDEIPADTQMREILDGAPTEPLRRVLPEACERRRQVGGTGRLVTEVEEEKYYTVALDGSEYFHSTKIACPGCLRQQSAKGELPYAHVVVAATLTRAGSHAIWPLDAEEVRPEDGQQKQACELKAGQRRVRRLRQAHRQLKICMTGAALYAPEPFILELRQLRMGFVLVANPTSHAGRFAWVDDLERRGECGHGQWEEGAGSNRRAFEYRRAPQVPLTHSGHVRVNCVEGWERPKDGPGHSHNSWVTDFAVTRQPEATLIGSGRSRWKIENEQFSVHKNHGSELEHNYGHGQHTLSRVF